MLDVRTLARLAPGLGPDVDVRVVAGGVHDLALSADEPRAAYLAAVVEQSHDEHGIVWPQGIAPYDVHVVVLKGAEAEAEDVARTLSETGYEVLLDDRDQRPGEKFADADLIGLPWRVTVGKKTLEDGKVDLRSRRTQADRRVDVADLGKEIG